MPKRKKPTGAAEIDGKQGTSRHAHHHDIVTAYDGEGSWSVKIFFGDQLRHRITGLRFEGEAYWAGDDWAHLNRILVADTKAVGKDYAPVVFENGAELVRLTPRPRVSDALEYAEQYVEQMRVSDREKVELKQARRAEYILKMREYDLIEAGFQQKIDDAKEGLKLAQERRAEWIEGVRNPQVEFNFVFDRKRARQTDIEDAAALLDGLGAKTKPTPEGLLLTDILNDTNPDGTPKKKKPPPKGDDKPPADGGEAHP